MELGVTEKKGEALKIGYVDDDQTEIDSFCRFARDYFEVETFKPTRNTKIIKIVDWVKETKISAIIVDYDLKEKDSIQFNGNEIVEKLQQEFFNFPSFILTSYEEKAVNGTKDSDIIFDKGTSYKNDKADILRKRIKNKIIVYRKALIDAENEYSDLIKKKNKMSLREEDKLLKLDSFIERSKGTKGYIPELVKTNSNYKKLSELVNKADKIISEIKKRC